MTSCRLRILATLCLWATAADCGGDESTREATVAAMKKAGAYFRSTLAVHGGYVYFYTLDLKTRWGEGPASPTQIWVQPPGTPTVGIAFLHAHRATGDPFFLNAARDAADALAFGQLSSGGWTNSIDCELRNRGFPYSGGNRRSDGNSSLDDGQTQSAIRLLVLADESMGRQNERIHTAATRALDALLAAQFPNGAFPQVWRSPVKKQPIVRAAYPEYDWRTEGRIKEYWDMYTTNDNVCGYVADTLLEAYRVYRDERYLHALKRLGGFLILAQMPDPQPAWAQQYNYAMHPIWARRFEPPGISGDESQEIIETLLKIHAATNDERFLAPIPRALDYLKRSVLADGRLARYYELKTNRPLYMIRRGKAYTLTYDDSRLPKHYGWKTSSRLDELTRKYTAAKSGRHRPSQTMAELRREAERVLTELDDQGRWVSTYAGARLVGQPKFAIGDRYLASDVFCENMAILARYVTALSK